MSRFAIQERCRKVQAYVAALRRLLSDRDTRRELLWYRARERHDHGSAGQLESCPRVRARVRTAEDRLRRSGVDVDDPGAAREGFGRLFLERLDRHLAEAENVPCTCRWCAQG